ncbi:MAG: insulinase family protein [Muribaculaceae bacterium]|nr:insulinase family protein [Muribaculaceae bacterium]
MTQEKNYHIATLPNGLRVVAACFPGQVSYIGMLVRAGSRNEDSDHEGLAHFVEHTLFKGTRNRKSNHISCRMEQIGGELNAYTTKEETMIYTNAPAGYVARSLDLIADLVKNSIFPIKEIEKEREVIIEEINSYKDSPSESVYDEFEELIYKGTPLSHNILGTPDSVRRLTGEDARGFLDRLYTPRNMVVYCCDPGDPEKNIRLVEKYLGDLSFPDEPRQKVSLPALDHFETTRDRDAYQANTIVGTRLFGRTDPRRHALFLFNNYLGGPCMNSRLNMEMRERRGLVYTVESNVSLLSDTGTISVFFGTDPASVEKCSYIIKKEIDRVAQTSLSKQTFSKIRDQYLGQMIVGFDNRESRAMALAKSLLFYDEIHDIDTATEMIRQITVQEFTDIAALILEKGLCRLTLK